MRAVAVIALLPLLVVVAIVVILATRHGGPGGEDGGTHALRRLLQYSFLLAALLSATAGSAGLLAAALPSDAIAGRGTDDLALGLSLTLVGAPAWLLLWRLVARRLAADPAERAAPAWALYLIAAATVSLVVAYTGLLGVGRWAVGLQPYEPHELANGVVWGAAWVAHAWLLRRPGLAPAGPSAQLAVLAGSVVGLVALAIGAGGVLRAGLDEAYRALAGRVLAGPPVYVGLRSALVTGLLAVPVWWWHWLRQGVAGPRTTLWHAYLMLVGVLGGLLAAVTAAGVVLHTALDWWLGSREVAGAAVHFEPVPAVLGAAAVGVWSWWYHHAVLGDVPRRGRTEPERAYGYLVATVGLVAAAAGVTVSIMAALQAVAPAPLATADPGGRDTLVAAITLLAVGVPLWWLFWRRLQAQARAGGRDGDPAELRSPSRRAYLFLLFGATGLTAIVSLAVLLYVVLRDLLDGSLAAAVLHDLRAAIGLVLTAGAVSAYHWAVYREDRRGRVEGEPAGPRSVLLVSADGSGLAETLAEATGARVRHLRRLDSQPHAVDPDLVTAAVRASPHRRVLVTVDADGAVRVIPYDTG